MASFPTVNRYKVAPAGNRCWEILQISTGTGAVSTSAELDFRSGLRYIESAMLGKNSTYAPISTAALTWTNASFPGNALITISGMSTAGSEKKFSLVLVGRR